MSAAPLELDELPALQGRAWVFGDHIAAAQILSEAPVNGGRVGRPQPLLDVDPSWTEHVAPGDVIVAGTEFGHGAATIATARALRGAGVAAVLARSFGAAFLEAAITVGLLPLIVEETGAIKNGDRLRIDVEGHKVANLSSGDRYVIRNIYGDTLDILRAGGRSRYDALRAQAAGRSQ